ncbi:glycosyltransferase family 87 protein [Corynebacterium sp. CCM 9204]|uniref:glycosyltransferase family 87 protein n=1 Tax=Corynebacterium sp. CCM 9204 TaxID=3057616 RepID=UPI0035241748
MSTHPDPRPSTNTVRDLERRQPGRDEPLARDITVFLGGPMGRFSAPGTSRVITPLRVLLCVALVFLALGWLSKANCLGGTVGSDGVVSLDWSGSRQYLSACYSDIVPLYGNNGLSGGHFPYKYSWTDPDGTTRYMEYPVLAGLFQWGMAGLTRLLVPVIAATGLAVPSAAIYFSLTAMVLSLFWILAIRWTVILTGNRVWDTVLVAASPLVIAHAFTNYDILAVAVAVGALLAAARCKPGLAGVLIGLGTAVKLWPLFLLGAYLVLALRNRTIRPFLVMLGTSTVVWLLVNLPVMLAFRAGWLEFFRLNSERVADWDSVYALIERQTGWAGWDHGATPPVILNTVSTILFIGACVLIGVLGLRARRTPRVAELVFLIVGAFLLFNKVWSPQYSLWLVPLAVLALPRWRLLAAWMLSEVLVWPVRMWFMAGDDALGAPAELFNIALIIRGFFVVVIMVLVVRQMLGLSEDAVLAAHHGEDPLAGDFDGPRSADPGELQRAVGSDQYAVTDAGGGKDA